MKKIIGILLISVAAIGASTIFHDPSIFKSTVEVDSLTASTALVTDSSKVLTSSSTTATELGYVHGVTSALQTQIDGKQATGNYITALTGDVTASGPGSVAATLATVNSNVGTFGSATKSSVVTVNGKGLVTAASESTVTPAVGSITGLGSNVATWLATPSSANLASALTDETGSGTAVFAIGSTIDLTSATGLPISTGVSGLASGVATFLATPSSANLRGALTDETGTGTAVFSIGSTISLTSATGLPISTGVSGLASGVATFLATSSSANLAAALTDETGTGTAVFSTGSTISLASATGLPISTGVSGLASGAATFLGTSTSANLRNLLTDETGTGTAVFAIGSTIDLSSATGLPLSTGVSGALPIANGGTGQTTKAAAYDALSPLTTLGDVVYGGASGTGTRLAGNITTTKKYLSQTGNASVSAAPAWAQVAFSDLSGSVTAAQMPALTGDVTTSAGAVATTIAANAVTLAKMAQVATATFLGRTTAATGNVEALSVTQATALLNVAVAGGVKGLVPSSVAGDATKFLRGDITWATPTGGSGAFNYAAKTANYTAVAQDYVNCTTNTFTVTLPTAVSIAGQSIKVFNSGTGAITINTTSAQTISGIASGTIKLTNQYEWIVFTSDGANWILDSYLFKRSHAIVSAASPNITVVGASNFVRVNGTVNTSGGADITMTQDGTNGVKCTANAPGWITFTVGIDTTGGNGTQLWLNGSQYEHEWSSLANGAVNTHGTGTVRKKVVATDFFQGTSLGGVDSVTGHGTIECDFIREY